MTHWGFTTQFDPLVSLNVYTTNTSTDNETTTTYVYKQSYILINLHISIAYSQSIVLNRIFMLRLQQ